MTMVRIGELSARAIRLGERTDVQNLSWIFKNGLHCRSSKIQDLQFKRIGLDNLIARRETAPVPVQPGGTLADYVPFYFTPLSMMSFNIQTGHSGVERFPPDQLAFIVASLHRLRKGGLDVVFTDGHAVLATTSYSTDLQELHRIDWQILRDRDFSRNPDDPAKTARYQAEALVYRHLPVSFVEGIACYSPTVRDTLSEEARRLGCDVRVVSRPEWYF